MRLAAVLLCLAGLDGIAHADATRVPPGTGAVPHVLYLDRCADDCVVVAGATDDARVNTSSLIAADATLTRMPRLDLVWAELVICLGEVLASYDVAIVTDEPSADTDYLEIMISGRPEELGLDPAALGAGPITDDCSPLDHGLAFAFSNVYDLIAEPGHVSELCATVAHQAGHLWGLEHTDSCHDLMGLADECADRRWFVDLETTCVDCACGADRQSSHRALVDRLGAGTGAPPPPRVEIRDPDDGAVVDGTLGVNALVEQGRPLERVELYLGEVLDDARDGDGTGIYRLSGTIERYDEPTRVRVLAFDDLGRMGGDTITVTQHAGGCAAAPGAATLWPLLLALALLLSRRRRSCSRAAAPRRAPRRSRPRAPAPPRAA